YMAGPPAMIDASGIMLRELGLRGEDIHADVFFTPEEAPT
ncbi:oxidoreductase, partial [Ochrobactrum sp. 23A/997/2015]